MPKAVESAFVKSALGRRVAGGQDLSASEASPCHVREDLFFSKSGIESWNDGN